MNREDCTHPELSSVEVYFDEHHTPTTYERGMRLLYVTRVERCAVCGAGFAIWLSYTRAYVASVMNARGIEVAVRDVGERDVLEVARSEPRFMPHATPA